MLKRDIRLLVRFFFDFRGNNGRRLVSDTFSGSFCFGFFFKAIRGAQGETPLRGFIKQGVLLSDLLGPKVSVFSKGMEFMRFFMKPHQ
ncbi:hypothetical protein BA171_08015 [Candidatus Hamiltonella defensa (Bemisia tabaci)]|uniref:Uncharacterized protein n=1 Tax=Candidatus Hamiltonella defensa (Bemisia tabaci) TaxID=672795 RepID=A0A249DZF0_9ENTR|nr:hypothetical protein BA171_08015 [Candidatus Hamiltonella defensa (Bemisia tabaci)]